MPSSAGAAPHTRVVGIGASAGGLPALELFLGHVPPRSGLAYVVVQHLDPTHKALLPELLQRITPMPVHAAEQGMRIEPDCVYVIPPNAELTIADGTLRLAPPAQPRGFRLPVNVLFSSLASAQGERAIAVVLSGMGSDGTLGAQAIKAVGGLTGAQTPDTAQFDSMPRSVIAAGCADVIAPPAELAVRLIACAGVPLTEDTPTPATPATAPGVLEADALQQILTLLHERTRHEFALYKQSTLRRRIERRISIHGLPDYARYAEFLAANPAEIDLLFKELLIGVTSFFRDPAVWQMLREQTLPDLLARSPTEHTLRAWVIGCSTGEEAYSLAMTFSEAKAANPGDPGVTLQIFASDLSPDAIAAARRGSYPLSIGSSVSAERLERFFTRHDNGYRVNERIRDMVLFAQHDVILDPPFTRLDLLLCRNLLIYFDPALQRRLIPLFHYSLRPGGVLLLGTSETVGRFSQLFAPIDPKLRLYLRQDTVSIGGPGFLLRAFPPLSSMSKEFSVQPSNPTDPAPDALQTAADELLLQVYSPAAVVVNAEGDIVYISGRTGKYLEPAAGRANWNIHVMAREGLRVPVADALRQAQLQSTPIELPCLPLQAPEGEVLVDVTVQALEKPAPLKSMVMIVFRDVPATAQAQGGAGRTQAAGHTDQAAPPRHYEQEILRLREQARASREELQSANEELQSTNEELQSTNEELTTSKEEMQSMNEELQTINNELQSKLDDLALAQSDMTNVLNSIEIAILFLDQDLNVRRYTDRAASIINLRENDVGRPLTDLTTSLQYPEMHDDALTTLRTLVPTEKQITANDDQWFSVRIMPYRRLDNVIDGLVITLVDITATKALEAALRKDPDAR
ncbi:MAG: PAS domain-containing protein [Gammaproteobacteria bacterium]|nr:PAS domain-containing protein [Gammaproteobacteria bacterium]